MRCRYCFERVSKFEKVEHEHNCIERKRKLKIAKDQKLLNTKALAEKAIKRLVGLSTGNIGAISELAVGIDLLVLGYEVFRCITPNSRVDLVASGVNSMYKIQVKTINLYRDGAIPPTEYTAKLGIEYDILAIVSQDRVHYFPAGKIIDQIHESTNTLV